MDPNGFRKPLPGRHGRRVLDPVPTFCRESAMIPRLIFRMGEYSICPGVRPELSHFRLPSKTLVCVPDYPGAYRNLFVLKLAAQIVFTSWRPMNTKHGLVKSISACCYEHGSLHKCCATPLTLSCPEGGILNSDSSLSAPVAATSDAAHIHAMGTT